MQTLDTTPRLSISIDDLQDFCVKAMLKCGMRREDAAAIANVLVTTDSWGVHSHGTRHLYSYLKRLHAGGTDPKAVPEVVSEGPGWAMIDSRKAMGMVASCQAMKLAIAKAKATGIGYVGVKHSTHFGAAGFYANMAAQEDLIGIAMSNVDTNMTVPGAKGAVIGNNPLAYAVPAGEEFPIMLDMALSSVAAGKIYAAQGLGKSIPDNWIVDDDGLPTTDITNYPNAGTLLPMAGHKGYGLAVMVEVLASVLTGAAVTRDVKGWMSQMDEMTDEGHAFIAIDIGAMMPLALFKQRVDLMIRGIRQSPKAKGSQRIYLPGEMEWEKRENALMHGICLPADVAANLIKMGEDLHIGSPAFREHTDA